MLKEHKLNSIAQAKKQAGNDSAQTTETIEFLANLETMLKI